MSLLSDSELEVHAISLRPSALVLLRHHLEASEGIAFMIAKKGGDALLVCPKSQSAALREFIDDMKVELGLCTGLLAAHEGARDVAL